MSKIILLDTNFLFGKRLDFDFLRNFKEKNIEIYISEIILDELKGQNIREIKISHEKIKRAIESSKYPELYFNIKDKTDLKEVFVESDSRMDAYFRNIFGDNIIPLPEKEKMFDILLERSKLKTPPFIDEKGASDKGFKDTLIWLDFINFCKDNHYDEYYIVSKDNGFIKYDEIILQEFKDAVGSDKFEVLQFTKISELTSKFLDKDEEVTELSKEVLPFQEDKLNNNEIDRETIQIVKKSVRSLLYTREYDSFSDYDVGNIILKRSISEDETIEFCNKLSVKKDDLLFYDFFDLSKIFDELNIENKKVYETDISDITNFVDVWHLIQKTYPRYKDAFLNFLNSELKKLVLLETNTNDDEDDLPF